jgi:hypothetical protein
MWLLVWLRSTAPEAAENWSTMVIMCATSLNGQYIYIYKAHLMYLYVLFNT